MSFTGINKLLKLVCREREREREVHICRVEKAILESTCKKYIYADQSCYPIKIVVKSSAYFHSIYIRINQEILSLGYHLTAGGRFASPDPLKREHKLVVVTSTLGRSKGRGHGCSWSSTLGFGSEENNIL